SRRLPPMKHTTRVTTARSSPDPAAANVRWETPPAVFAKLQEDFGPFLIDLTADETNHLLPAWVGPGPSGSPIVTDALVYLRICVESGKEYGKNASPLSGLYSNPPYDYTFLNDLVPLCGEVAAVFGTPSTLLLPVRTTSEWWHYLLRNQLAAAGAAQILFCDSRICFFSGGQPMWNAKALAKGNFRADSAAFDSVVVHFHPDARGHTQWGMWAVPEHVADYKPGRIAL
ncbi:MAG: phage N-6-adenine-methyltransferase, partial [Candidatus Rokubacteria bacterium]|nr:phage N-6-adenine-methyltransferase [Candidatus Rokubacteria bacterium]